MVRNIASLLTGKSELARIIQDEIPRNGPDMIFPSHNLLIEIEENLLRSAELHLEYSSLVASNEDLDGIVCKIAKKKKLIEHEVEILTKALKVIRSIHFTMADVKTLTDTPFNADSEEHVKMLQTFWSNLHDSNDGELPPPVVSTKWTDVGFQCHRPEADFRGMGLFGLIQLLHFTNENREDAVKDWHDSVNGKYPYSFAIVGINISAYIVELLNSRTLDFHLLHAVESAATSDKKEGTDSDEQIMMNEIHRIYARVFRLFHDTWFECCPASMMEYGSIFKVVKQRVESQILQNENKPVVKSLRTSQSLRSLIKKSN